MRTRSNLMLMRGLYCRDYKQYQLWQHRRQYQLWQHQQCQFWEQQCDQHLQHQHPKQQQCCQQHCQQCPEPYHPRYILKSSQACLTRHFARQRLSWKGTCVLANCNSRSDWYFSLTGAQAPATPAQTGESRFGSWINSHWIALETFCAFGHPKWPDQRFVFRQVLFCRCTKLRHPACKMNALICHLLIWACHSCL